MKYWITKNAWKTITAAWGPLVDLEIFGRTAVRLPSGETAFGWVELAEPLSEEQAERLGLVPANGK